jgi:hypothetical protein
MAQRHDIADKANVMPGVRGLPLDPKPSRCANLHRFAGDGKSFAE